MRWILALIAALAAAAPAGAATLYGATSFHVFGDSLSDTGRIHDATFGLEPRSPPYWRGRFSDGPVWAERVEDRFRAGGLPRSNQAFGGARAVTNFDDLIPDLGRQARRYADLPERRRGAAPMAAIAIGANDVIFRGGGAKRAGRAAADEAASVARYLGRRGVERVLFLNLPDLGLLPRFAGRNAAAGRATRGALAYNARLDRRIGEMRDDGRDVVLFDLFAAFEEMRERPGDYGLSDLTEPCLVGRDRCGRREAQEKLFFDDTHPSATAHARLAELVLGQLEATAPRTAVASAAGPSAAPAPVPLPPGLLLLPAGIAALAAARARARRRPGPALRGA